MYTNEDKNYHGRSAKLGLQQILELCSKQDYIKFIVPNFRLGEKGYKNQLQFFAPFLIEFNDGTQWVLYTTTSMRTDRIKGQQWDISNLKKIDPKIQKAYLIYPDDLSETEKNLFLQQNNKYLSKDEYSVIDEIIPQNKLNNLIEAYALKDTLPGTSDDKRGNNFEKRIADILSYQENLEKWKTDSPTAVGSNYNIFKQIVSCFGLIKNETIRINATSDKKTIGTLPSGGMPKTDVLVCVTNAINEKKYYTISCKRSNKNQVSGHQYKADTFADVLDKNNQELRKMLNEFQSVGGIYKFGTENCEKLTQLLKPYVKRLTLWVVGGYYGLGNPQTQWANYILFYNDNDEGSITIDKTEEFCNRLVTNVHYQFGTPFQWTYPSKGLGKYIQLKL